MSNQHSQWDTVIGLEVHVQLNTQSKLFSASPTKYGAAPNSQANAIDLAMPGMLPVLNEQAVHKAIKLGLSIGAEINLKNVFARKNYFYPDLPKGYQISQHDLPIVHHGQLTIDGDHGPKTINIERAHLEEDAGKSMHEGFNGMSGIDLNRAGTPLIEVVSAPELSSAKEAVSYLKALHQLVQYLDISDANMQEGSFRCDANVSIKPAGSDQLGTRAEIKNINSFRFVEKAIEHEVERQIKILSTGGTVVQETRLFDANSNTTRSMRSKEEANDYRYFPDPDLLPVQIEPALVDHIKATLPELPWVKNERLQQQYQLSPYDAGVLTNNQTLAEYFEAACGQCEAEPQQVANWVTGELLAALNKNQINIADCPIHSNDLACLLNRISDNTISGKIAKTVFEEMWCGQGTADDIISSKGLKQITDPDAITSIIAEVIADSPQQLAQYRDGKEKLFGYFVGQVMKRSKGQANPEQVNQLLKTQLSED